MRKNTDQVRFFEHFIVYASPVCGLILGLLVVSFLFTSTAAADDRKAATKTYQRIISLYSAHTENLVSMGAGDQLVGISISDNYPEEILTKKRFSYREDPERFLAVSPDLILIRPMIERSYPQLIGKLRDAGIAVVSLQPTSVEGIFDYWRELGRLCGKEHNAEKMVNMFQEKLSAMAKQVSHIPADKRQRVYFESIHSKMKTFAPTSIAIFALEQAGGINIATDARQVRSTNIAAYSKERILAHAGEIDIFVAQKGRMNPIRKETIAQEPGFQVIKAIQNNEIYLIDEHLVSRPTLRLLEGIETLYDLFYDRPETVAAGGQK
jgi:iron complex transport system substrate-binding protein